MAARDHLVDRLEDRVVEIADLAEEHGRSIAAAESLTSGRLAAVLGAGPEASLWWRGGVVAYSPEVKFDVLGVRPGPVNCAECAEQMARGVRTLIGADLAIATTGVGGPGEDEGVPEGTVFVAVDDGRSTSVQELHLEGDPEQVLEAAVEAALERLRDALQHAAQDVLGAGSDAGEGAGA
ncbi:CinA family protein [Nocardioides sp.]|uniref:CinA family protein n=1 Tax=Nocardioides sp. TaxID=35761 RepID=UPI0035119C90